MDTLLIPTEDANKEQWKLLSQFTYPANVKRHFREQGLPEPADSVISFITASILQAQAYYSAAVNSHLTISPLLLYYGTSNLLSGIAGLITGNLLPIQKHGMALIFPEVENYRIAELSIKPNLANIGSLQLFSNVFSQGVNLVNGGTWTIEEILGSIPDLKIDFEQVYPDSAPYTLPVEVVNSRRGIIERISLNAVSRFSNQDQVFAQIENFKTAYLDPQRTDKFVILHRKVRGPEIGERSIFGKKYLHLGHQKERELISPSQLILMYMGLFGLGHISRYKPEIWNRFVTSDETGERLLLEKFLDICQRYCPNLGLNALRNEYIQFANEIDQIQDRRTSLTDEDIKKLDKLK